MLLRDKFTPAELMLSGQFLLAAIATFWIGDPRSIWLLGSLLILGILTPIILKTHEYTHPFFIDRLWPRFWLYTSPVWVAIIQFSAGLTQNPLRTQSLDGFTYQTLSSISIWQPTSVFDSNSWITLLGFCATYVMASLLFIVPKSLSFFERSLTWLCLTATILAIFGYIQMGVSPEAPLWIKGTGRTDFFAFFPYDGHWAAFAALWCCTSIAMALHFNRDYYNTGFINSIGTWYLAGGILLGGTGLFIKSTIPASLLLMTLAAMLMISAADFLLKSKDTHRISIALSCGVCSLASLTAGILKLFQENELNSQLQILRIAAVDMFKANPVFGWGIDSYQKILPFFSNDKLIGQNATGANSDWLQIAAEFGAIGLLIPCAFIIIFIARYLKGEYSIPLTNHMLVGCVAVLALASVDNPFMSPAVFFSFLIIFFSSMRWADLSRKKVDEVDADRPQLISPESDRSLPFFTDSYSEKHK